MNGGRTKEYGERVRKLVLARLECVPKLTAGERECVEQDILVDRRSTDDLIYARQDADKRSERRLWWPN